MVGAPKSLVLEQSGYNVPTCFAHFVLRLSSGRRECVHSFPGSRPSRLLAISGTFKRCPWSELLLSHLAFHARWTPNHQ